MTTEREKLAQIIATTLDEWRTSCMPAADAILAAGFRLVTPSKDVMEGAKAVVDAWEIDIIAQPADLAEAIAAFATAHAARKKEACAAEIDELLRSFTYESDHAHPGKLYNDGFVRAATACAAVLRAMAP